MNPYPIGSPLLASAISLLAGALAIGSLEGCSGQPPTPTAQTGLTSSQIAIAPSALSSPALSSVPKGSQSPGLSPSPSPSKPPDERSEEALAQLSLLSLTSGQQARFAEKKEFAPAIADLDKKWRPLERYEIAMKAEGKEKVLITAKAKDDALKSYTAVVYGFGSTSTATTVTCGTLLPSQKPPTLTALPPQSPDERLFCPPRTYRSDSVSNQSTPKKP